MSKQRRKDVDGVQLIGEESQAHYYVTWAETVTDILGGTGKGLAHFLTEKEAQASETKAKKEDSLEEWNVQHSKAKTMIRKYVFGETQRLLQGVKTAHEMWTAVQNQFQDTSGGSRVISLKGLLEIKQLEGEDMKTYINRYRMIKSRVKDTGTDIDNLTHSLILILGCGVDYATTVEYLMALDDKLTFEVACQRLLNTSKLKASIENDEDVACYTHAKQPSKSSGGHGRQLRKKNPSKNKENNRDSNIKKPYNQSYECIYCGARGKHYTDNCPDLLARQTKRAQDKDTAHLALNDSSDEYISHSGYDVCLKTSLLLKKLDRHGTKTSTFYSDSAATDHMSHEGSLFKKITQVSNHFVKIGNGVELKVHGIGDIEVMDGLGRHNILKRVLFVPGLTCNLFSTRRLHQSGHSVVFPGDNTSRVFIYNQRGKLIMTGTLKGKLYEMDFEIHRSHNTTTSVTKSKRHHFRFQSRTERALLNNAKTSTSLNIWHQRLNHISRKKIWASKNDLNIRVNKRNINTTCICSGCAKAKMKRRHRIKARMNKETKRGAKVHTDVFGPFKPSRQGYRYVISFIDEATRHAHVYMMHHKNEALDKLKKYKKMIEGDIELKSVAISTTAAMRIKCIQSDNGGEYTSKEFIAFLENQGIKRYTTNADEPSQNGISERYGRSIQEAGLAILKHAKLS